VTDDLETRERLGKAGPAQAALYRWEDSARELLIILEGLASRPADPRRRISPNGDRGDDKDDRVARGEHAAKGQVDNAA
jgi:hypothetical protein